jgi:hypothetical protein
VLVHGRQPRAKHVPRCGDDKLELTDASVAISMVLLVGVGIPASRYRRAARCGVRLLPRSGGLDCVGLEGIQSFIIAREQPN